MTNSITSSTGQYPLPFPHMPVEKHFVAEVISMSAEVSNFGIVSPLVHFHPVILDNGHVYSEAYVENNVYSTPGDIFRSMWILIGDKISLTLKSGYVEASILTRRKEFADSYIIDNTRCTSCHHQLSVSEGRLLCTNESCRGILKGRTSYLSSYMGLCIPSLDPESVDRLIINSPNYRSLSDLFDPGLELIDGADYALSQDTIYHVTDTLEWYRGMIKSRQYDYSEDGINLVWRFIMSLSIRGLTPRLANVIVTYILMAAPFDPLGYFFRIITDPSVVIPELDMYAINTIRTYNQYRTHEFMKILAYMRK